MKITSPSVVLPYSLLVTVENAGVYLGENLSGQLRISVDVVALLEALAGKALRSKGGKSQLARGAVVVKRVCK